MTPPSDNDETFTAAASPRAVGDVSADEPASSRPARSGGRELDGDVLTVDEAAVLLKVGRNTLYEACARNEVPCQRIGRQIRFSRAALMRWLGSWSKQDAQEGQ